MKAELPEHVSSFVGESYNTRSGTTISILSAHGKVNNVWTFKARCNVCSEDKVLWPDDFIIPKSYAVKQVAPCGCAKNPSYTQEQYVVLIERECRKRGYIFKGFTAGFKNRDSKIKLYDTVMDFYSETTPVGNFLRGGDTKARGNRNAALSKVLSDEAYIQMFMATGKFKEGTIFRLVDPDNINKLKWEYSCPICSEDGFVKAGVCSGVFKSTSQHLKEGKLSCRCSSSCKLTLPQKELLVSKICEKEDLVFNGVIRRGKGRYKDTISWVCKAGHVNSTFYGSFVNAKDRCNICRLKTNRRNGFYPERVDDLDNLYIAAFKGQPYIKIGRTFNLKGRIKGFHDKTKIGKDNIKILNLFSGNHADVYDTEQETHAHLRSLGLDFKSPLKWSNELFIEDSYHLVLDYLSSSCLKEIPLE